MFATIICIPLGIPRRSRSSSFIEPTPCRFLPKPLKTLPGSYPCEDLFSIFLIPMVLIHISTILAIPAVLNKTYN